MTEMNRRTLEEQGWKRQNVTDEKRLDELVDFYRELAFEVMVVPFDPKQEDDECTVCFGDSDKAQIIYTRKME